MSFYASCECIDRGLDPLTTNLVVADESRTDGTICLAVSPSLKARKISGRARLFEVKQRLQQIKNLTGEEVHFIIAPPRMQRYLDVSAEIYSVYLNHIAPDDLYAYSVDEVFINAEPYLTLYGMNTHELAMTLVRDVLATVGITATAGIGTNPYLAKVAMDIVAKHIPADKDGVRIAELDEQSYREKLWAHEPLTDFWMIGGGISNRLAKWGIHTMGDIARLSLTNEDLFFREFGVDAELILDRAWGEDSVTMWHIKNYRSATKSFNEGQVLKCGYDYEKTRIVIREMTEQLINRLVDSDMVAEGLTMYISYDWHETADGAYSGPTKVNYYGKTVPKSAHGTAKLGGPTACPSRIMASSMELFEKIMNKQLCSKHLGVSAIRLSRASEVPAQMGFFTDLGKEQREIDLVRATLQLKKRFGRSAVFKGCDLLDGATTLERNGQIGGHRIG
ncbi:DinB/UmuC family translesion DNA polymerase [Acutalibacter intestini]|uniref:Y-family DNA polymerase n=1 Tax=Acutalibacter intestini TaxID=3093659 RepID=UPI003F5858E9